MPLHLTAQSLTLNTHASLNTDDRYQVPTTVSLSSSPITDALSTSPITLPVQPSDTETSIDAHSNPNIADSAVELSVHQSNESVEAERETQQLLNELALRDMEVRQHELTHAAAGGQYAGAPTYEYQRGPDGRLYAVAGEVSIDTSAVPDDPQATLEKAEVILRAALAVAEPSPQDRSIAAQAAAMAAEARAELAQQSRELDAEDTSQYSEERREDDQQSQQDTWEAQQNDQAEKLQDFNQQLVEVNLKLAEIHQKLIDAGVFKKLFDEGFIFDERV
ncbi:putative metalloprotease CJM1_0395 family protein [Amphritea sp. 1_MG-2023]|uniref:putative metalloprotease CJM1_0395 family protein n=1 Tax=Amphritea sp. 1_MG-2023 TaxID=3062670 RepID=UPI0026E4379C|nr:putative metalloprotease CJM1_0395 family protein [Amphritea sp. 1_MG-2023]MDO6562825.1 putative metalloprotease CJM1_0395 family protein [Amphritea sp. 1_MG-2023]